MSTKRPTSTLGVALWNHYEEYEEVERSVEYLHELGVTHIRTGISWADWCRNDGINGAEWHKWLFDAYEDFDILPCVWLTPGPISENGKTNGPPKRLLDYADFLEEVNQVLGDRFEAIELWNEPNNLLKWDREYDPNWEKFAEMILHGARTAQAHGKKTVLGGLSPMQCGWMKPLWENGAMDHIDVVAAHAFPGQWNDGSDVWGGWPDAIDYLRKENPGREIWITEVGASTSDRGDIDGEMLQKAVLDEVVATCSAERKYFYTLGDLVHDELEWAVFGKREPLEHSLGLVTADGRRKQAFYRLQEYLKKVQAPVV